MATELEVLQRALVEVEDRIRRRWTVADSYYRSYLIREIEKLRLLKLEMVDVTISIYSVCRGKKGQYYKVFQAVYDVDAWRNVNTGIIDYRAGLTGEEIIACLFDFRARWGWSPTGVPAPSVSEPKWIETSMFEREEEPRGASIKLLIRMEEGEETYRGEVIETIYRPTDEEIRKFKAYGGV